MDFGYRVGPRDYTKRIQFGLRRGIDTPPSGEPEGPNKMHKIQATI